MPPPEDADSWGEYRARLEWEEAEQPGLLSVACRVAAALLFVIGLLSGGYALTYHHWWMWLCSVAAFAVLFKMATRAKANLDREGERAAQLEMLDRMWQARVERRSPSSLAARMGSSPRS
jgi:hypothetical protein